MKFSQVGNSLIGFSSDLLVFCEQKRNLLVKKSESLPLLFWHEQPEQIAHGRCFVKSDGSESLKSLFEKYRFVFPKNMLNYYHQLYIYCSA